VKKKEGGPKQRSIAKVIRVKRWQTIEKSFPGREEGKKTCIKRGGFSTLGKRASKYLKERAPLTGENKGKERKPGKDPVNFFQGEKSIY